ncbi:MAG: M56 family metallopeptidase [Chitinophagaceae bacterium]
MNQTFTDNLLRSLSWTFIHSLWQGLVITILAGLLMLFTRRSTPGLRYGLLCGLLCLFLLAVGASFAIEWGNPSGSAGGLRIFGSSSLPENLQLPSGQEQFLHGLVDFFNRNTNWIVSCWFLFLVVKLTRMLLDLAYVSRLRNKMVFSTDDQWQGKFSQLCKSLGINKEVKLLESALVKVPLMAGHLKPVILLPLGVLTNLTPGEVEAVLLHELAHIRRNDYLVNLVQRIVELFFFFNPGFLWVSSLVRREREHCCDDLAIKASKDKLQFVHALISFRQHSLLASGSALGFPGSSSLLVQRMARIVYNRNATLSGFGIAFFTFNILLFIGFIAVLGKTVGRETSQDVSLFTAMQSIPQANDLHPEPDLPLALMSGKNGNDYILQDMITADSLASYQHDALTETDEMKERMPADILHSTIKGQEKVYHQYLRTGPEQYGVVTNRQQGDKDWRETMKQYGLADAIQWQADLQRQQAEIERQRADQERVLAGMEREQADKERVLADRGREQAGKERVLANMERGQAMQDRMQADNERAQAGRYRDHAYQEYEQYEKDRMQTDRKREQAVQERMQTDRDKKIIMIIR